MKVQIMRLSGLAPHGLWLPLACMAMETVWPELGRVALGGIPVWSFVVVLFGVLSMSPGLSIAPRRLSRLRSSPL